MANELSTDRRNEITYKILIKRISGKPIILKKDVFDKELKGQNDRIKEPIFKLSDSDINEIERFSKLRYTETNIKEFYRILYSEILDHALHSTENSSDCSSTQIENKPNALTVEQNEIAYMILKDLISEESINLDPKGFFDMLHTQAKEIGVEVVELQMFYGILYSEIFNDLLPLKK